MRLHDNHLSVNGNLREVGTDFTRDDSLCDYLDWYSLNEDCSDRIDPDYSDEYEGLTIVDHPHITGTGSICQFRLED